MPKSALEDAIAQTINSDGASLPSLETLERRDYSQKERDEMDDSDFGDPENQAFPIKTAQDVINAASRLHNASGDQQAIKARIKRIAKRKGFALPQTWQDEEKDDSDGDGKSQERAASANHDPFTGKHTHAHPAFGSQGDDQTHEHEHEHNNDADHHHSHTSDGQDAQERSYTPPESLQTSDRVDRMYAPFLRVDSAKREVTGQATAEVPDAYGTIFGFYPRAFELWRGNIREQHDSKKAVGKRVDFFPHPESKTVDLLSRVSRGAQDTWLKVEDDVLTGYSLNVIPDPEYGNDPRKWPRKEYNGKLYPYLPRYTISEVSLVDNPACPGCNIQIVRADGFATEVLDLTEDEDLPPAENQSFTRAGARVSAETRAGNHKSISHSLQAVKSQMQNCGCDDCQAGAKHLDPDGDGDIDAFGGQYGDDDGDAASLYPQDGNAGETERLLTGLVERIVTQQLTPVFARLQGIAGSLARSQGMPASQTSLESIVTGALSRAMETLDARLSDLPTKSSLDEVRAELSAVKGQVDRIAETPMPGAPVLNSRAVEKRLPTDNPYAPPSRSGSAVYDAIAGLANAGALDTMDKQVDAMAAGLRAQRLGGR